MSTTEIIIALLGLPVLAALITHWFDRRKAKADAADSLVDTSLKLNTAQDARIDDMEKRITALEAELQEAYIVISALLEVLKAAGIEPNTVDANVLKRVLWRVRNAVSVHPHKARK